MPFAAPVGIIAPCRNRLNWDSFSSCLKSAKWRFTSLFSRPAPLPWTGPGDDSSSPRTLRERVDTSLGHPGRVQRIDEGRVGVIEMYFYDIHDQWNSQPITTSDWSSWKMFAASTAWWKKSCITWDVRNPVNDGRCFMSGAGFLPSTGQVASCQTGYFCRRQYEHDASLAHRGAVTSVTRSVTVCFHGTNSGDAKQMSSLTGCCGSDGSIYLFWDLFLTVYWIERLLTKNSYVVDAKNLHLVDQANGFWIRTPLRPKEHVFHKMFLLLEKLKAETSSFVEW